MNREERNGYEVMRDERDIARAEVARLTAASKQYRAVLGLLAGGVEPAARAVAADALRLSAEAGDTETVADGLADWLGPLVGITEKRLAEDSAEADTDDRSYEEEEANDRSWDGMTDGEAAADDATWDRS